MKNEADENDNGGGKTREEIHLMLRDEQKTLAHHQQNACDQCDERVNYATIHIGWRIAQIRMVGFSIQSILARITLCRAILNL
jgi:hypothetical protein